MNGQAIGHHFARLYVSCPDLNPIEQAFANSPPAFPTSCACWNLKPASLKNTLRKMSRQTVDALWEAIGISMTFRQKNASTIFAMPGMGLPNRNPL
jgi:hypothetical protein